MKKENKNKLVEELFQHIESVYGELAIKEKKAIVSKIYYKYLSMSKIKEE